MLRKPIPFRRLLLTTDPAKLKSLGQPLISLQHKRQPRLRVQLRPQEVELPQLTSIKYQVNPNRQCGFDKFPEGTKGFFYYLSDPQLPAVSGALRFRVAETLDEFDNGKDAKLANGKHWHIPLFFLSRQGKFKGLKEMLINDGLVERDVFNDLARLPLVSGDDWQWTILSDIDQEVELDLEEDTKIRLLTRDSTGVVTHRDMFLMPKLPDGTLPAPLFSGAVRAKFELSKDLAAPELNLRIIELLTPVARLTKQDLILPPEPGMVLTHNTGKTQPWVHTVEPGSAWDVFLKKTGRL